MATQPTAGGPEPAKPVLLVYVSTINDESGNPRRGWIAYDGQGRALNFITEGYAGRDAIPPAWTAVPSTGAIGITPMTYKHLVTALREPDPGRGARREAR